MVSFISWKTVKFDYLYLLILMSRFHLLHCTDDTINLSLNSDDAYKLMFLDQVKLFFKMNCVACILFLFFFLFIVSIKISAKMLLNVTCHKNIASLHVIRWMFFATANSNLILPDYSCSKKFQIENSF